MTKRGSISLALLLCLAVSGMARADVIGWNTWASDNTSGTMPLGSTTVDVTFSTNNAHSAIANYPSWTPTSTWADGSVVDNAPVASNGIMQLFGGSNYPDVNVLTFSSPVVNPVMAIWSLGGGSTSASFVFLNATPTFVAGGPNAEYGGTPIVVSGNTVTGIEGNGTVQFLGTFTSISWENPDFESWYGFNVGAVAVATTVPEPSSALVLLAGAVSVLGIQRLRRG